METLPGNYDAWKLASPYDEPECEDEDEEFCNESDYRFELWRDQQMGL